MFGEVRIEEITLRTGTEHHLRPFAEHAKVSGRCKSMRLERAMCDFGIEDSFASANKRLLEHYGFKLCAGAMRSATLKHAARAEQKLKAEYAQPYRELPAGGPGVIIAEADGSMPAKGRVCPLADFARCPRDCRAKQPGRVHGRKSGSLPHSAKAA